MNEPLESKCPKCGSSNIKTSVSLRLRMTFYGCVNCRYSWGIDWAVNKEELPKENLPDVTVTPKGHVFVKFFKNKRSK